MAKRVRKTLVIPNETRYLAAMREAVAQVVQSSDFPNEDMHRVVLAVDEAVANIMEHALAREEDSGELTIRMALDVNATQFQVTIQDSGKPFDPEEIEAPDIREQVAAGRRDGLGVFLIRQIMDEVRYSFVQGLRNELHMAKYVHA